MKSNIRDCSLLINHTVTLKMANKNVDEIPQAEWEFSWPVSIAQCIETRCLVCQQTMCSYRHGSDEPIHCHNIILLSADQIGNILGGVFGGVFGGGVGGYLIFIIIILIIVITLWLREVCCFNYIVEINALMLLVYFWEQKDLCSTI